ncbi:unnamed protein product [Phytomonas sp. EM1]|nr:unnamed protein product [Phytomonas sp. EM1]|eukprot:CCW63668.1 unnamed protein product [Phytomonas sp. isolate EM1]
MSNIDDPGKHVWSNSSSFLIANASSNSLMGAFFEHQSLHGKQSSLHELREVWLRAASTFPPLQTVLVWGRQLAALTGVEESIVWTLLSMLLILFVYYVVFRPVFAAIFRGRRDLILLIGLPASGKTALLSQIACGSTPPTQTSIEPNRLVVDVKKGKRSVQRTVVDYPGSHRLRSSLPALLEKTHKLVVVIDSVTIHDDLHEGAHTLADLLVFVFQSPAFSGVKGVLFACTKRDELTSYSLKAIQKLLEAAMARALTSRKGDLGRIDEVLDSKGRSVAKASGLKSKSNGCVLHVDERGAFSFNQLEVPHRFVEVSSFPNKEMHAFSAQPVLDFII